MANPPKNDERRYLGHLVAGICVDIVHFKIHPGPESLLAFVAGSKEPIHTHYGPVVATGDIFPFGAVSRGQGRRLPRHRG